MAQNVKRQAPVGKFRVVGVDTFSPEDPDWVEGDFDDLATAQQRAQGAGGEMTMMHIYDDQGRHVDEAGTF